MQGIKQEINNKEDKNQNLVGSLSLEEILESQQACGKINLVSDEDEKDASKFTHSDELKKKAEEMFKKNGGNKAVYFVCNTDGDVKAYEVPIERGSDTFEDVEKARSAIVSLYTRCMTGGQGVFIREVLPKNKIARDEGGNVIKKGKGVCFSDPGFEYIKKIEETEGREELGSERICFVADPASDLIDLRIVGTNIFYKNIECEKKFFKLHIYNITPSGIYKESATNYFLKGDSKPVEHPDKNGGVPVMTPEKFKSTAIEEEEEEDFKKNIFEKNKRRKNQKEESGGTPSKGLIYLKNISAGTGIGVVIDVVGGGAALGVCFATGALNAFLSFVKSNPILTVVALGSPIAVSDLVGFIKSIFNTRNDGNGGGKEKIVASHGK